MKKRKLGSDLEVSAVVLGCMIPGTKRQTYLKQNAEAAEIILSQEELASIEDVFPKGAAAGLRYPEALMKMVNA